MMGDKLYRERRNICTVQLGHCLCMLWIVWSLVFFFFFFPYRAVGCYCLWIWLAIGHDVRLPPGTLRVAWGRESCSVAKLNPQKKELRL